MKRKLLFAMLCIVSALGLRAQVYFETDMTSQFSSLTQVGSWHGATGYTATNFCPKVTTNSGQQVQVCEKYEGNCNSTGDIFYATVTGLAAGTYKIELYGGAAYTFGRGFTSEAFSTGTWNAGDKIEPTDEVSTGVTLYAESEDVTYGGEIPIYYATNFPEGAATVTLDGVVVGTSGTIKIGMTKTSKSTNWHVIQLKGVTATVDATALIANANATYEAIKDKVMQASLKEALETAKTTFDADQTSQTNFNAYKSALDAAETSANEYEAAKTKLDAMKALTDATNFYTEQAYAEYYGTPLAKYEARTLTTAEAQALQNPTTVTGWHDAITVDNLLLSVWDADPDVYSGYYINTWSTEGSGDGSNFVVPFFEYWTEDGKSLDARTLKATLTGLEANEYYNVEIWARVRQRNSGTKVAGSIMLSVNGGAATDITAGAQVGSSQFYLGTFKAIGKADADGNLVVDIAVAANSDISWLSFKNAKYTKIDDARIPLSEQLADAVAAAEAKATSLSGQVPASAIAAISDLVAANKNVAYDQKTAEEFNEAIQAVNTAVANAEALVEPYAAYNELKAYAEALVAVANDNATANSTLASAISTAETDVNNAATAADIADATATLKAAMVTYAGAANPVGDGVQFDLTFMLTNPDVTKFWNGTWGIQPEGWYKDLTDGNFQVMGNEEMGPGGEVFMEYWSGTAASNGFVLCQKVNLPEGTYKMTGRTGIQQYDGNGTTANVTFSANDIDGTQIPFGPLSDSEIEFVNASEQEVRIGLKAHSGNNARWMGINKIHLYKVQDKSFVIDEAEDYVAQEGAGDVELKRTIKVGVNTLVLPFSMTQEEIEATFGAGSKAYTIKGYANETISFEESTIAPNVPVVLVATEAGTEYTLTGRTMVKGTPVKEVENAKMVGTYAKSEDVAPNAGNYGFANNKLYLVDSNVTVRNTRAYITLTEPTEVKVLSIVLEDGTETAIQSLVGTQAEQGAIYNLNGQRVEKAVKGIYIIGGKKVLVK